MPAPAAATNAPFIFPLRKPRPPEKRGHLPNVGSKASGKVNQQSWAPCSYVGLS